MGVEVGLRAPVNVTDPNLPRAEEVDISAADRCVTMTASLPPHGVCVRGTCPKGDEAPLVEGTCRESVPCAQNCWLANLWDFGSGRSSSFVVQDAWTANGAKRAERLPGPVGHSLWWCTVRKCVGPTWCVSFVHDKITAGLCGSLHSFTQSTLPK